MNLFVNYICDAAKFELPGRKDQTNGHSILFPYIFKMQYFKYCANINEGRKEINIYSVYNLFCSSVLSSAISF